MKHGNRHYSQISENLKCWLDRDYTDGRHMFLVYNPILHISPDGENHLFFFQLHPVTPLLLHVWEFPNQN